MIDYGLKVSLPGKDVSSENPRDFVFSSKYGTVKVFKEPANKTYETVTISAGDSETVTIEHGLGFPPLVMLFTELKPGSGHWYQGGLALTSVEDSSNSARMDGEADSGTYVDDTYLKIRYTNSTGSELTVKYYYYIFADSSS